MKTKWFYPLQKKADEKLQKMYPRLTNTTRTVYQTVSKERVIEHHHVFHYGVDKSLTEVIVLMVNNKANGGEGTLLIYEAKLIASN